MGNSNQGDDRMRTDFHKERMSFKREMTGSGKPVSASIIPQYTFENVIRKVGMIVKLERELLNGGFIFTTSICQVLCWALKLQHIWSLPLRSSQSDRRNIQTDSYTIACSYAST